MYSLPVVFRVKLLGEAISNISLVSLVINPSIAQLVERRTVE